jgi:hypothetical protein
VIKVGREGVKRNSCRKRRSPRPGASLFRIAPRLAYTAPMSQAAPQPQFRDQLLADASLLAQKLDLTSQRALFLRLGQDDYAQASFLDDRILTPKSQGMWVGFSDIAAALAGFAPTQALHFIFHAGHVGSTLVSRLLEGFGGVLGLREPLTLRTLAEAHDVLGRPDSLLGVEQFDALLHQQILLWGRGFAGTRASVVKATSAAARLGPALLRACPTAKALYLHLPLEPYLATLLAGENSPIDLRGHAGERMRRLARFGIEAPGPVHAMSLGELAAMAWVVERLTEAALVEAGGARVLALNFERVLAAPEASLRAICAHFELAAPEEFFTQTPQNPVWRRYAKAPEHPYSPHDRAQILAEARAKKAGEIRRGLLWVDALAAGTPSVAGLLI